MDSIKYIDRQGLADVGEFVVTATVKGIKNLMELREEKGISVGSDTITKSMDSLGNKNVFTISDPWQMTNEECEYTVRVINAILGTRWEFKQEIHMQMNIRKGGD